MANILHIKTKFKCIYSLFIKIYKNPTPIAHKKEHLERNNSSNIIQAYKFQKQISIVRTNIQNLIPTCVISSFEYVLTQFSLKKKKNHLPINTTVKHQRNTTAFQKI